MNMKLQNCSLVLLSWLIFFPLFVVSECDAQKQCECDAQKQEDGIDVKQALKFKIIALASILVASLIGVCLPMLGKRIPALEPEKDIFFVVKSFAAGVILATAFINILPDAFEKLTSPCLNIESSWGKFRFTGFIIMVAATLTMMIDTLTTAYYSRRSHAASALPINNKPDEQPLDNSGLLHIHDSRTLDRYSVLSLVLGIGITVHSIIIGLAVGVSQSPLTIKSLMIALVFHQFLEGMGLGGCIAQGRFKPRVVVTMALLFSFTTPIGILIGMAEVSSLNNETSPWDQIFQGGVLNAAASGILIYVSLVNPLAADFMSQRRMSSWKLMLIAYPALFAGMGLMSVLAI